MTDRARHRTFFHPEAIDQSKTGLAFSAMSLDNSYHVVWPGCVHDQLPVVHRGFPGFQGANKTALAAPEHADLGPSLQDAWIDFDLFRARGLAQPATVFGPIRVMVNW